MPLEPVEPTADELLDDEAEAWLLEEERDERRFEERQTRAHADALDRAQWAAMTAEQRYRFRQLIRRVTDTPDRSLRNSYGWRVKPSAIRRGSRPIRVHAPRRPRARSTHAARRSDDPHEPDLALDPRRSA
jgi:hypothetical protein